jgi:hypothetical protein
VDGFMTLFTLGSRHSRRLAAKIPLMNYALTFENRFNDNFNGCQQFIVTFTLAPFDSLLTKLIALRGIHK